MLAAGLRQDAPNGGPEEAPVWRKKQKLRTTGKKKMQKTKNKQMEIVENRKIGHAMWDRWGKVKRSGAKSLKD